MLHIFVTPSDLRKHTQIKDITVITQSACWSLNLPLTPLTLVRHSCFFRISVSEERERSIIGGSLVTTNHNLPPSAAGGRVGVWVGVGGSCGRDRWASFFAASHSRVTTGQQKHMPGDRRLGFCGSVKRRLPRLGGIMGPAHE